MATALVASSSSACLKSGSAQALGDDPRAVVRADLGLVGLDDGVERGRVDVALLGQNRFERAHAQLGLGQVRDDRGRGHGDRSYRQDNRIILRMSIGVELC